MVDDPVETFPPLIPDTIAVASKSQRETEEMEGGGEKMKVDTDAYDRKKAEKVVMGETMKVVLETSAVAF